MKIIKLMRVMGIAVIIIFAVIGINSISNHETSVNNNKNISTDISQNNRNNDNQVNPRYKELATSEHPVISPSGKYMLQIVEGYNGTVHFNQFYIIGLGPDGTQQEILYFSKDVYRTFDTLYFLWDKQDRVWVYTGDTGGAYYWEEVSQYEWKKHTFTDNIELPQLLKKLRPKLLTQSYGGGTGDW